MPVISSRVPSRRYAVRDAPAEGRAAGVALVCRGLKSPESPAKATTSASVTVRACDMWRAPSSNWSNVKPVVI
jgi:hypothetical protein